MEFLFDGLLLLHLASQLLDMHVGFLELAHLFRQLLCQRFFLLK